MILLAHDDEFVVAVHDELFRTVFEFLARRFDADHGNAEAFMHASVFDGVADHMRGGMDFDDVVCAFKLDVVKIVAGHKMSDAFAGVGFRVDDVACADALQNAGVFLRHGLGPNVGDAGVEQITGGRR